MRRHRRPTAAPPAGSAGWSRLLFADVTGSTALGEQLDPERLPGVLEAYFAAMREEIEAEGGTVEKYIGDAVMAAFGVPVAHEDDPARALRAALRMRASRGRERELGTDARRRIEIRIGVNTGEVLATIDPPPGEPMVTGDAVNVAARCETAAEPGTDRGRRADRAAPRAGSLRGTRAGSSCKGKRDRSSPSRRRGDGRRRARGVPGLARRWSAATPSSRLLRSVYERVAADGRPHLVTVYGDAGVGKSRLTREFLELDLGTRRRRRVVRGRCLPYGEGVTYWPLAEILKGHAGVLDTDPPELAVEKVRKAGRELLTTESRPTPRAPPPRSPTPSAWRTPTSRSRPRIRATCATSSTRRGARSSRRSARDGRLVTVVEDIHWADPVLLDLLEELAERVRGARHVLCPSRPELRARRPGWGGGRRNAFVASRSTRSSPDEAERWSALLLAVDDLPADRARARSSSGRRATRSSWRRSSAA